jgi:hypothetical protein
MFGRETVMFGYKQATEVSLVLGISECSLLKAASKCGYKA